MRDRTPRTLTGAALRAARQGVALDPFDDVDDLEQQAAGGGHGDQSDDAGDKKSHRGASGCAES